MNIKKLTISFFLIFLCYTFPAYAGLETGITVPENEYFVDPVGLMSEIRNLTIYSEERANWLPTVQQLNTLVYLLEHQAGYEHEYEYVTVLGSPDGFGYYPGEKGKTYYNYANLRVYLSDEPMILKETVAGGNHNVTMTFESGNVLMYDMVNGGDGTIIRYLPGKFNGYHIGYTATQYYLGSYHAIEYHNYDVDVLEVNAYGNKIVQGGDQNYEKYKGSYHGGGGTEIPELDSSIPNPSGLMAKVNTEGTITITWDPQIMPMYGVQILGDSKMRAYQGLVSHDFESFKKFESYDFETSYLSSFGAYNTNAIQFTFELPSSPDDFTDKTLWWFKFRLNYYKREDGVLKIGGTTSITVNVDDGITRETIDTEGNITVEEFDKDGNPKGSGGNIIDNIIDWLKSILQWLKTISSFASGIVEFNRITFNKIVEIADFIKNFPALLVDNFELLIKRLILPSDDYFQGRIDRLKAKLQAVLNYEYYIEVMETIQKFTGGNPDNITATFGGITVTVVSFTYIQSYLPRIHSLVRGFAFFTLLVYYINNFYKLIRGTNIMGAWRGEKGGGAE